MTAAYIRSTISKATRPHITPYDETFNRHLDYENLRVFGTECFAHVPKMKRSKLDDSGVRCCMLGYLENQKEFRLLNASTGQIMTREASRLTKLRETARVTLNTPTFFAKYTYMIYRLSI